MPYKVLKHFCQSGAGTYNPGNDIADGILTPDQVERAVAGGFIEKIAVENKTAAMPAGNTVMPKK